MTPGAPTRFPTAGGAPDDSGDEDDQIRASVVVAHNNLFIRTNDKLFCIAADE